MSQIPSYNLALPLEAVKLIAEHLKAGVYNNVAGVLNEIASQVARQEHDAEQKLLQQQVSEAAQALPEIKEAA